VSLSLYVRVSLSVHRASPSSCSVLLDLSYIRRFHFLPTSTSASGYFFNSFMVRGAYSLYTTQISHINGIYIFMCI
jgi:hypothetical protein